MPHQLPDGTPQAAIADFLQQQEPVVALSILRGAMKNQDMNALMLVDSIGIFDDASAPVDNNPYGTVVHLAHGLVPQQEHLPVGPGADRDRFDGPRQLRQRSAEFVATLRALFDKFITLNQPSDAIVARFLAAATVLHEVELFKSVATHLSKGIASLHDDRSLWVPIFGYFIHGDQQCHPVVYALLHGQHEILDLYLEAGWRPHMTIGTDAPRANGFNYASSGCSSSGIVKKLIDCYREVDGHFTDGPGSEELKTWAGHDLPWWAMDFTTDSGPLHYMITAVLESGLYDTDPQEFFSMATVTGGTRICEHVASALDWNTLKNPVLQALRSSEHWSATSGMSHNDPRPGMTAHTIALAELCVKHGRADFLSEALPRAHLREATEIVSRLKELIAAQSPESLSKDLEA